MHIPSIPKMVSIGLFLSVISTEAAVCFTPTIETKTASVDRTKVGYAEFQQSSPPEWKIYKSYVSTYWAVYDAVDFTPGDSSELYTMLFTYQKATTDPNNYAPNPPLQDLGCTRISAPESYTYSGNASYYHSWDYINSGSGSESCETTQNANGQWIDPACADRVVDCDHGQETLTVNNATTRRWSWSNSTPTTGGWTDCYGYRQESLETEYATPELIQRLSGDLAAASYSGWSQGAAAASFHLTSYKKCGTASKFVSRISFNTQDKVKYYINYTLRTNRNGTITFKDFQQTTIGNGGSYVLELPEVIPTEPETDISLQSVSVCYGYHYLLFWSDEDGVPFEAAANAQANAIRSRPTFNTLYDETHVQYVADINGVIGTVNQYRPIPYMAFYTHGSPGITHLSTGRDDALSNISENGGYITLYKSSFPPTYYTFSTESFHLIPTTHFLIGGELYLWGCHNEDLAGPMGIYFFGTPGTGYKTTTYYPLIQGNPVPVNKWDRIFILIGEYDCYGY